MKNKLEAVQELVNGLDSNEISLINDKFHSFEELYTFRMLYNVLLFNEWGSQINKISEFHKDKNGRVHEVIISKKPKYDVHKSIRHHDGELCFGGGWFVVVAILPSGQITNHYEMEHWSKFKIPTVEKALYPFDNHTANDVINRLLEL
jgi:hypothetical protein